MSRARAAALILVVSLGLGAVVVFGSGGAGRQASPSLSSVPSAREPLQPAASSPPAPTRSVAEPKPPWVHESKLSEAACLEGMLLVDADFCPYAGHRCTEWLDMERDRCRRYDEKLVCEGRRRRLRVCIDRYEYPNLAGVLPAVMVDWTEARRACELEKKRLCTESEWTLACEGPDGFPYPYGYVRDATACNIDRPHLLPDFRALETDRGVGAEVERLDKRVPSGALARCVSPFGVQDMTGNVDEWVVNESGKGDVSGLKGGYYGPIRARCRPITTDHNRWFRFYQVGFRCCADPLIPRPR